MKILRTFLASLGVLSCLALSQTSHGEAKSRHDFEVIERGPHHKVVRSTRTVAGKDGTASLATNQFTVLGNGLNREEGGKWVEAAPFLVETNDAILGLGAAHKATFPLLITGEPVHVRGRRGDSFKARVIGLAYHDPASGTNVLIAGLKESRGVILSSNRLVYPNCFDEIRASVAYTFDRGSVHQDVVLEERPPMPEEWGLSSNTTFLVVISEILDAPNGKVKAKSLRTASGTLEDDDVSLGSMRLVPGRAFATKNGRNKKTISVAKQYSKIQGRRILFEKVAVHGIADELNSLPPAGMGGRTNSVPDGASRAPSKRQNRFYAADTLPDPGAVAAKTLLPKQMAAVTLPKDSFVIDWALLTDSDAIYLDVGTFVVNGPTYFTEAMFGPDVVIKYMPNSSLHILDSYSWDGSPGKGILTAANDNTRGEYVDTYQPGDGPYDGDYGPAMVVPATALSLAQSNFDVFYAGPGIISEVRDVSIAAFKDSLDKATGGEAATFRVNIDIPGEAVTVFYTVSGTAQPGSDYVALSGSVTIPQGANYVDVTVNPAYSSTVPLSRLVVSLSANSAYTVNPTYSVAQVYIKDSRFSASPLLVNVDMVPFGSAGAYKAGYAATGQSDADFWNGAASPWRDLAVFSNLKDARFNTTTISCVLSNTPGTWGIDTTDLMYHSYLYPFDPPGAVVLTNVPSGNYHLYLYSHDGNYELTVGSTSWGTRTTRDWPVLTPLVWEEGRQYCVFRNIPVTSGQALTITLRPGIDNSGILGGLQLVSLAVFIVTPPANQTITYGQSATFSVAASGDGPLQYQWRRNQVAIPGATSSTLNLPRPYVSESGSYDVIVTCGQNQVTSAPATLVVQRKALTVTARNETKPLNAPIPVLTGTVVGLESGDGDGTTTGITASYSTSATRTSPAGNYPIVPSLNDPSGRLANYQVTLINGILTITSNPQNCQSRTFTSSADFLEGSIQSLTSTGGRLQFSGPVEMQPYLNVACSVRGTLLRINVDDGSYVGQFLTSPEGMQRDPSRTTVDRDGCVWVANRAEGSYLNGQRMGSVTKIGWVQGVRGNKIADASSPTGWGVEPDPKGEWVQPEAGHWADRDGDGLVHTSWGWNDILPWNDSQGHDRDGGVETAEDELILAYVRVLGTGIRTVAVDWNNDIWVGGSGAPQWHQKLDSLGNPIAGTEFSYGAGGYGGLVDLNGVLWSARSGSGLLRYDPSTKTANLLGSRHGDYGLGVDPRTGEVWYASAYDGSISKYAPDGQWLGDYRHSYSGDRAQGIVIDNDGNIWVAHAKDVGNTVGHLRTDGQFVGAVDLRVDTTWTGVMGPTGVAIDRNGKVWVANYNHCSVMRINPTGGQLGNGGHPIGEVDLTVPIGRENAEGVSVCDVSSSILLVPANPYNYSDMTGYLTTMLQRKGSWTVVQARAEGAEWKSVSWNPQSQPAGTYLVVEARDADSAEDLNQKPYQQINSNASLTDRAGRLLQIRATLTRDVDVTETPVLDDLTVSWCGLGNSAPVITTQPQDIQACEGVATFSVVAQGSGGLSYQWYFNGQAISGATSPSFTVNPVDSTKYGNYHVVVTSPYGSVTSRSATLSGGNASRVTVSKVSDARKPAIKGTFTVTRTCGVGSLTVYYSTSGTANNPTPDDYIPLSGSVTIPNGKNNATIEVTPKPGDTTKELILTLSPNPAYLLGSVSSASMTIAANRAPQLGQVDLLEIPANRGSYTITLEKLLLSSHPTVIAPGATHPQHPDTLDPDGDPLVFVVDEVVTGTLLIDGQPHGPQNNTIKTGVPAKWLPPSNAEDLNKAAFRVHAFDGAASSATVDVRIAHAPKRALFAWGSNWWGEVGNGKSLDWRVDYRDDVYEQQAGIIERDPRWQYYEFGMEREQIPQKVFDLEDLDDVVSFYPSGSFSCAVGSDGYLYQWGWLPSALCGIPKANAGLSQDEYGIWTWGETLPENWVVGDPIGLCVPTPRIYTRPNLLAAQGEKLAFRNLKKAIGGGSCQFVLLAESSGSQGVCNSLWSWGSLGFDGGALGRDPDAGANPDPYPSTAYPRIALQPGRVCIPGNGEEASENGETYQLNDPRRSFVEIGNRVARCEDQSVWFWGGALKGGTVVIPKPGTDDNDYESFVFDLTDPALPAWKPVRLLALETPGELAKGAIVQVSMRDDNIIILRKNNTTGLSSVSELGYIPRLGPPYGTGSAAALTACYKASPEEAPQGANQLPRNIVQVSSGGSFGTALTATGDVYVWGYLADTETAAPRKINFPSKIEKIEAGLGCVWAIDVRGRLWGWGGNDLGTLRPSAEYWKDLFVHEPVMIQGIENVFEVNCGVGFGAILAKASPVSDNKVTGLKASPGNQQVKLQWNAYPGASFYKIYRYAPTPTSDDHENPSSYTLIHDNCTSDAYTDLGTQSGGTGLENGKTYYYMISAVSQGVESERSWEVGATPFPPPSAVTGASVSGSCRSVVLGWNVASTEKVQEIRVLRAEKNLTDPALPLDGDYSLREACPGDARSFTDNDVISSKKYYYRIIPVNLAGAGPAITVGPGTLNAQICPPAPYIPTDAWRQDKWFLISPGLTEENNTWLTLHWAKPAADWGGTLVGFRIQCRTRAAGRDFRPYSWDIGVDGVELAPQWAADHGLTTTCYKYTWLGSELMQYYVTVSALVQVPGIPVPIVGDSSIEVGPPAVVNAENFQDLWTGEINSTPGYEQVFLQWAESDYQWDYTIKCTTDKPGAAPPIVDNSFDYDAYVLKAGETANRYWHSGLSRSAFSPVEIRMNDGTEPAIGFRINNDTDPVSTLLRARLTTAQRSQLNNRESAAQILTSLVQQPNTLIFDPATLVPPMNAQALSAKTESLLALRRAGTLPAADLPVLNRLLLEDAYRAELARAEEAAPAEFVSRDVSDPSSLGYWLVAQSDALMTAIWNRLSAQQRTSLGNPANHTVELLSEVLTTAVQKKENDVAQVLLTKQQMADLETAIGIEFSPRVKDLSDRRDQLSENEIYLLNRLLIEEARQEIRPMRAYKYYFVEAYLPGYSITSWIVSHWTGACPSFDDVNKPDSALALKAIASPYSSQVNIEWFFSRRFNSAAAGAVLDLKCASPLMRRVTRFNSQNVSTYVATVPGADFTLNQAEGTITILAGSGLICAAGDYLVAEYAPIVAQGDWQFWVERKEGQAGTYEVITDPGFGLAYLDDEVKNGNTYYYRVVGVDSKHNSWLAETGAAKPLASSALLLNDPVPGNHFVDLTWTAIRAASATVRVAPSANGPWNVLAELHNGGGYTDAPNSYRHIDAENGKEHFYKVTVLTPTGFEYESNVKSATPSADLAPLPPAGFRGEVIDGGKAVLLRWNSRGGITRYQIFFQNQSLLVPVHTGAGIEGTTAVFEIPDGIVFPAKLVFLVRGVSASGLWSENARTTVTCEEQSETVANSMSLVVAGCNAPASGNLMFQGPTNLTLSLTAAIPDAERVTFYADGMIIGSVARPPFQILWSHVPGGLHSLTATAEIPKQAANPSAGITTVSTAPVGIEVEVKPELTAFQTSVTDLQLPAPGLPITIARSYNSRDPGLDGASSDPFAVRGWQFSWRTPSIKLSANLGLAWKGLYNADLGQKYYIEESAAHELTVTLPDGQTVYFRPELVYNPANYPELYDDGDLKVVMRFQGYMEGQGELVGDQGALALADNYTSASWEGQPIAFESVSGFVPQTLKYTAQDGTQYSFESASELSYRLASVVDLNGNSLTYTYDSQGLKSITHSSGRKVTFAYSSSPAPEIAVYDSEASYVNGSSPVIIYELEAATHNLKRVKRRVSRQESAPTDVTTYAYDSGNRLTEVYDARGVRVLLNTYLTGQPELESQKDVNGRITSYTYNPANGKLTLVDQTTQKSVQILHDESGNISGATQPKLASDPATPKTVTDLKYNDLGLLESETGEDGICTFYSYDSAGRLVQKMTGDEITLVMSYYEDGRPKEKTENGVTSSWVYDSKGNLRFAREPRKTTESTYSTPGSSQGLSFPAQIEQERISADGALYTSVTKYEYTTSGTVVGELKKVTRRWEDGETALSNPRPIVVTYEYDYNGNLKFETRQRTTHEGAVEYVRTENIYDAMGRVTETIGKVKKGESGAWEELPYTHTFTQYNLLGKQKSKKDGYGRETFFTYDLAGRLIETLYPDGTVSRTTYDVEGRVQYTQDRTRSSNGVSTAPATRNTYDVAGRTVKVERFASVTLTKRTLSSSEYVALTGQTPPAEYLITMEATAPTGAALTTSRTYYDDKGRVKFTVQADSTDQRVVGFGYDAMGRRTSTTNYLTCEEYNTETLEPMPSGDDNLNAQVVSSAYDSKGNQKWTRDGLGHQTDYEYDAENRLSRTIFPQTGQSPRAERRKIYDGLGHCIQETDEAGVSTYYTFDFDGRLTSVKIASDQSKTYYDYDEFGNLTGQQDAEGRWTRFAYDSQGRRTHRVLPGGTFSEAAGNAFLEKTSYSAVQVAGSAVFKMRRSVKDFRGRTQTYDYDVMDRLVTVTPAATDALGNAIPQAERTITTFSYNDAGQRMVADQTGGTVRTVRYAYDELGRLRAKLSGLEGTLTYGYDGFGAVKQISAQYAYAGNLWGTVYGTAWEQANNRSYNSGLANLAYNYDGLGRLSAINPNIYAPDAWYDYDNAGNLRTASYQNNVVTTYSYDERNRLRMLETRCSGSLRARFDYDGAASATWPADRHLSPVGQRRRVDETIFNINNGGYSDNQTRQVEYDYDVLRRLVKEGIVQGNLGPLGKVEYPDYDKVGNRKQRVVGGYTVPPPATWPLVSAGVTTTSATFNELDQPTAQYTFDAAGNVISDGTGASYEYDSDNRLIRKFVDNLNKVEFQYDADGNRVRKTVTVNGVENTTLYLVDDRNPTGYAQVIEEITGPSTVGLVGRWRLDEGTGTTTSDSSGNGYNGTLVNGAVWSAGRAGGGVTFDGVNDYIQVGAQPNLVVSSAMTIGAWIRSTGVGGVIVCKEGEYEVGIVSGTLQWAVANTSPGWSWVNTGWAVPANQWVHIAIVYGNNEMRTYANGSLVHTRTVQGVIGDAITAQNDFRIGGRQAALQYFTGNIDEVHLYNRALTAAEVQNLAGSRTTYVYGLDLISQTKNGTKRFYGYDGLGSVRYLTDATGVIKDTFTYDAFGILIDRRARTSGGVLTPFANPALETPPAGTTPTVNNYRYTGEQWDQDLGMYYLRARYYRPELGRFWTMDSFEGHNEDPQSLHKYSYCRADPVGRIDPSGHMDFNVTSLLSSVTIMEGLQGLKAGAEAKIKWEMRAFQQELLNDLSPKDLARNEKLGYEGEEVWVRYLNSIGFRAIRAKGPVSQVGPDVYAARVKNGRLEIMIGEVKASKKGIAGVGALKWNVLKTFRQMSYSWIDKYASQVVDGIADLAIDGIGLSEFKTLLERGEVDLYLLAGLKSGNTWKICGFRLLHADLGDVDLPGNGPAELTQERTVPGVPGI